MRKNLQQNRKASNSVRKNEYKRVREEYKSKQKGYFIDHYNKLGKPKISNLQNKNGRQYNLINNV